MTAPIAVGVDTGGTFTDLVACDKECVVRHATKVSTTPADPSIGILEAFATVPAGTASAFLHGTTTGTNALIERRGALTALLVTKGFRDILELARQNRPSLYDWFEAKSEPLVPRALSREIDERHSPRETVRRPLNVTQAREVLADLRAQGVESVAICLLHSYQDSQNELRLRALVESELPGVHVSLSSEVLRDIMEYERASTTVANAYLAPVMERYLTRLVEGLRTANFDGPIHVMQSSGGLGSAETIANRAVQTILSGPAAGVIGGLAATAASTKPSFLTIDMGGTSFDIAYSQGREPSISRDAVVDGHPIAIPALDIHTLGAGGGSIAWIDAGGILRVGPESAGSQPGPACYGRGGATPTVTDANLLLGRLGDDLLGGRLNLDAEAAQAAIERAVARPLGLSIVDAARGIVEVANAAMAKGMRLMSVARGRDPRDLGIVAFGGAGALHACELAEIIGTDEVIVPILPGNTSAIGLALASVRRDRNTSVMRPLAEIDDREADALLDELTKQVAADLQEDGVVAREATFVAVARVSYHGQRYQIDVPFPSRNAPRAASGFSSSLAAVADSFRTQHLSRYGYIRDDPLTLFGVVVAGFARVAAQGTPTLRERPSARVSNARRERPVWFGDDFYGTALLERDQLSPGHRFEGPAIIDQADATTVLPPGWDGSVDAYGNLLLRRNR